MRYSRIYSTQNTYLQLIPRVRFCFQTELSLWRVKIEVSQKRLDRVRPRLQSRTCLPWLRVFSIKAEWITNFEVLIKLHYFVLSTFLHLTRGSFLCENGGMHRCRTNLLRGSRKSVNSVISKSNSFILKLLCGYTCIFFNNIVGKRLWSPPNGK